MSTSIIIPVWNGASVIKDCLEAVYRHSGPELLEVICEDNGSKDESAAEIREAYPQVRLIQQPVNLGFAGGVNAGMGAAKGDTFVLLNQDCIVQPGWLDALLQAMKAYPSFGIFGCTINNADGTVHHTGATIRYPDATGEHLTDLGDGQVRRADFVTGAAMAIRRQVWDGIGGFDEGYYPAYYEDCDYCYRARHKGFETAWVPQAQVRHLFTSQAWKKDPIRHAANGYTSRYRFICKHFSNKDFEPFFEAEIQALRDNRYLDHALGRMIAAHDTLRDLAGILERRRQDLDGRLPASGKRQLQEGFQRIHREAFELAKKLVSMKFDGLANNGDPQKKTAVGIDQWAESDQELLELRKREETLFDQCRPSTSLWGRLKDLYPGHYRSLMTEFNDVQIKHMAALERRSMLMQEKLKLLELLVEYEFR